MWEGEENMNIFIIHSGMDMENVAEKKKELNQINIGSNGNKKANVLLLEYRRIWKPEVKKLIKSAQIVLYILSKDGYKSKNIDWEIRQAKKQQKAIVVLNEGKKYTLNKTLYEKDPFTKEDILIGKEIESIVELFKIIEDYENGEHIHLFNEDEIEPEKLFEQYKLFSDTSESLVARRQNVNSFYITANTALITIAATAFSLNNNLFSQLIITIALSIPGILLNRSWLKILESYGLINSSKMKILGMLEKKLSASLFDAEWRVMSNQYNKQQYTSFADGEKHIPKIFNAVFILVDIICIAVFIIKFVL